MNGRDVDELKHRLTETRSSLIKQLKVISSKIVLMHAKRMSQSQKQRVWTYAMVCCSVIVSLKHTPQRL